MPNPPRWRTFLSTASRSRSFLWKVALAVLAVGFAVGLALNERRPAAAATFAERVLARAGLPIEQDDDALDELPIASDELGTQHQTILTAFGSELGSKVGFPDVFYGVPEFASYVSTREQRPLREIVSKYFSTGETDLLLDYIAAWNLDDRAAYDRLVAKAAGDPALRFAHYALGRIEWKRKDYVSAARAFEAEGKFHDAIGARYRAIAASLRARDFERLTVLRKNPAYRILFTPYVRLKIAAHHHDWSTILRLAPILQIHSYVPSAVAVSLVAAFAWMLFLAHLGEWNQIRSGTTALCAAGFVLGVLSTVAVSYVIIGQEDVLTVAAGNDPAHIVLYYIAGVGAREEVCKLALFLPLVPMLLKRDDELEVLIVASFVGLGFAIEENATYFANSDATSAAGRFLTANFFHLALTGINGLALFRSFRWGVRGLNEFLWIFPATIAAHGAYDALQSMPQFAEGPYVALGVFLGSCLLYFKSAQELRTNRRMTLSLSGAFVIGVSILAATVIAYHIAMFGPRAGVTLLMTELAGCGSLVVVFFKMFNEPLAA